MFDEKSALKLKFYFNNMGTFCFYVNRIFFICTVQLMYLVVQNAFYEKAFI